MFTPRVLLSLIIGERFAYHFAFIVDEAVALGFVLHHDTAGCDRGLDYTRKVLEGYNNVALAIDTTPIVVSVLSGKESAFAQIEVEVLCRHYYFASLVDDTVVHAVAIYAMPGLECVGYGGGIVGHAHV